MTRTLTAGALIGLLIALLLGAAVLPAAAAKPYLAKPGKKPVSVRVGTPAVSGGFMHLYAALDAGLFDKYGLKVEHVYFQGAAVSLTALASNEVQFLYSAADATIPGMATGIDGKLVGSPLVGIPYVLLARKDIQRLEDLKGKSIGVTLRPLGGSQPERGTKVARKADDLVDNGFAEHLDTSGFLRELWGGEPR